MKNNSKKKYFAPQFETENMSSIDIMTASDFEDDYDNEATSIATIWNWWGED